MSAVNIYGLVLLVSLLCSQLIFVQSDEKIITANLTLNNIYKSVEIFNTNSDLIVNLIQELISKEPKQLICNAEQIFNSYYENLTPREKEILKHKIGIILEIYLKLKDLMIHDFRYLINYSYKKWSKESFIRLIKININVFTDVLDGFSYFVQPLSTVLENTKEEYLNYLESSVLPNGR